ncbi:MbcA/ParS/Xre antitoxin family protein [Pseudomonas synxantha]|uniref:Toxin-antitoxin system antitoxin component (TIGR02293 family) n=1 Tax=Pseudomonas synxantha TaxID=47883 RepID=A0ACC6JHD0_9PSED|nr:MbcA/ParS/Xre antitoxin family protein [Pseudomonas synxantha]MDR6605913.1 putative toxin-antitoxin system antitoxin component (TIGR02293 family) [Pseudomonas synxantha]
MLAEVMRENVYRAYRIRLELMLGISRDASEREMHYLIEAGFILKRVIPLTELYLQTSSNPEQVSALRKMVNRKSDQSLSVFDSDRLFRFGHITAMAEVIFGDETKAMRWLSKPKRQLAGRKPYELLSTTPGTREVERMLIQISEPFAF